MICAPVLGGWYKDASLKYGFVDDNLQSVFRQLDLGKISEDDILDYFLTYKGVQLTRAQLRREVDAYLKLDESLVDVIKGLRQKGFKTALLSNATNLFFERKLYPTYPEFKSLFDEIIISSSVGMVKPNTDIYLYALKKIKSKPEESLFIDDGKLNVDVAIGLGMNGFVYENASGFQDYLKEHGII